SPAPALRPIQVHRLRLELAPAQRAREVLSKAWGKEVGLSALLVQAAAKALDELPLPYAALLGRREGETIKGHLLPPGGLRALVSGERGPEGEGLFCLTGGEEIHTGAPLLYLHEEGLLTLSGPFEPSSARALLERVKAYLEEPLLLFA
ncbi:MAG: E3 binding domain-containing protein, partial [Thermaceae bacterium]